MSTTTRVGPPLAQSYSTLPWVLELYLPMYCKYSDGYDEERSIERKDGMEDDSSVLSKTAAQTEHDRTEPKTNRREQNYDRY